MLEMIWAVDFSELTQLLILVGSAILYLTPSETDNTSATLAMIFMCSLILFTL